MVALAIVNNTGRRIAVEPKIEIKAISSD